MRTFTTRDIAALVRGELVGPGDLSVAGVEQVDLAEPGDLTFIGTQRYAKLWPTSRATAALVSRSIAGDVNGAGGRALILVTDADIAMASVLEAFAPSTPTGGIGNGMTSSPGSSPGSPIPVVHPTAVVDPSARLGAGVHVGAHCVIGPRVQIGSRTLIYPNVVILDESTLGSDCVLWPGVVVRDRCTIGDRCIFHPNASIGADGFGYRPNPDGKGLIKIPQIGTVQIGSDVEIGSCTCIDRGKFSATVIGDGCKIDNLCHIAHNCRLGKHVILTGTVGLAGSVTIGDGAMLGGGSGIADHVNIGAGAEILAQAGVMRDVAPGERVCGVPAKEARQFFREVSALSKLPDVLRDLRKQEK